MFLENVSIDQDQSTRNMTLDDINESLDARFNQDGRQALDFDSDIRVYSS